MMNSEDSQLVNLNNDSSHTETDSPPIKVRREAEVVTTSFGGIFATNCVFLADPYNDSDLRNIEDESANTTDNSSSIEDNPERVITPNESNTGLEIVQAGNAANNIEHPSFSSNIDSSLWDEINKLSDQDVHQQSSTLCQSTINQGGIQDDHVPPEQETASSADLAARNGQAADAPNGKALFTKDSDGEFGLQQSNVDGLGIGTFRKDEDAIIDDEPEYPNIDFSVLDELKEVLNKNQTKTKEMLLEEYLSCPKKYKEVKDFLSKFRQSTYDFLKASGENIKNSVGSAKLKTVMEKPGWYTMVQLLADVFKNMETKMATAGNKSSNINLATDGSCVLSQSPTISKNVQEVPDITSEKETEKGLDEIEIIDISNEDVPTSSSSSIQPQPSNVVDNTITWQEKINDKLLHQLHVESNCLEGFKKRIIIMGKRLFTTLFSEHEIVGGLARVRKNIPAYDKERVYEMSQIINFMLNSNNDCSLEKFRSGQRENKGLKGKKWDTFWNRVMIHYANDERARIKGEQSQKTCTGNLC